MNGLVERHLQTAWSLAASHRYDEAVVACKRGHIADPHDPRPYLALAELYYLAGKDDDVRIVLEVGLSQVPNSFALAWARCVAMLRQAYDSQDQIHSTRAEFAIRLGELRRRWRSGEVSTAEAAGACFMVRPFYRPSGILTTSPLGGPSSRRPPFSCQLHRLAD